MYTEKLGEVAMVEFRGRGKVLSFDEWQNFFRCLRGDCFCCCDDEPSTCAWSDFPADEPTY